ncbi:hypothetical protein EV207_10741 [Scopulibacillus darangshiensis]|uniref:ABC-2 family transporter n=1 Tax=Scopulibacillus darangshiensis TaxID=442528 RepID=A0A4R2P5I0_9BACL|nr:hypothetical protein [Scopulibacillus darangshiensis]TCP29947.1 hypothetical protein EV207_10741 [Scopulibacillus darangshiensis]
MLNMEINRIYKRPVFWLLILVGLILALWPVIQTWPPHVVTDRYYVFYPRSAYVSWMYFISPIYYIYVLIFPLLSALAYSDAYAEDYNTGLVKGILTRIEKKSYLLVRYGVNFCVGGFVATFPLFVNFIGEMAAYPLIENNYFFGMALVKQDSFFPELFYNHPLIYTLVRLLLVFLLGGMLASLGLAFSTSVKNRYIVLVFPFLIFMVVDILTATINEKYSLTTLFLQNSQGNRGIPFYLLVGIIGSFIWYYIAGDHNETI